MKKDIVPGQLDVGAFAQDGGVLRGEGPVRRHSRLLAETHGSDGEQMVTWQAHGELRATAGGPDQVWLHLEANATLPMVCQRCLTTVDVPVHVDRAFRFVPDEKAVAEQDDEAEEDLLVLSPSFDLLELVEDELLMELPVVPKHEVCPVDVKLAAVDPDFEAAADANVNPFAVLQKLRSDKGN